MAAFRHPVRTAFCHSIVASPPARWIRHIHKATVRQRAARIRHELVRKAWMITRRQDAGESQDRNQLIALRLVGFEDSCKVQLKSRAGHCRGHRCDRGDDVAEDLAVICRWRRRGIFQQQLEVQKSIDGVGVPNSTPLESLEVEHVHILFALNGIQPADLALPLAWRLLMIGHAVRHRIASERRTPVQPASRQTGQEHIGDNPRAQAGCHRPKSGDRLVMGGDMWIKHCAPRLRVCEIVRAKLGASPA